MTHTQKLQAMEKVALMQGARTLASKALTRFPRAGVGIRRALSIEGAQPLGDVMSGIGSLGMRHVDDASPWAKRFLKLRDKGDALHNWGMKQNRIADSIWAPLDEVKGLAKADPRRWGNTLGRNWFTPTVLMGLPMSGAPGGMTTSNVLSVPWLMRHPVWAIPSLLSMRNPSVNAPKARRLPASQLRKIR